MTNEQKDTKHGANKDKSSRAVKQSQKWNSEVSLILFRTTGPCQVSHINSHNTLGLSTVGTENRQSYTGTWRVNIKKDKINT